MEDFRDALKAFVEGEMDLPGWRIWWQKNASDVEPQLSRQSFLRLKHQPFRGAENLLEEFGIAYTLDRSKCRVCGETVFDAIPGQTTEDEIVEFVRRAKMPGAEQIEKDRWIHPGRYCPNGCTFEMHNYGSRGLFERMEEEFERTHTCPVTITSNGTPLHPLRHYSIYIDGNVAVTRDKDRKATDSEFVWLLPGEHRIVVRERDFKKANRLESNTLWFTASEDADLRFEFGLSNGQLELIHL